MTRIQRRSRLDMRLGRFLRIDHRFRYRADGTVWRVRQVHRADCEVELERGGVCRCIPFEQLRADWKWIAETPRAEVVLAALRQLATRDQEHQS